MRISTDQLAFALSVLAGEPGAHQILADMLEEAGDRGLAAWARASKGKRHKRIDFVLALLPPRLSLQLSSDFLAKSLTLLDSHQWPGPQMSPDRRSLAPAIRAVEGISAWCGENVADDSLQPHRDLISSLRPWSHGIQNIHTTMHSLRTALDLSQSADSMEKSDPRAAMHHARESRHASRKVAKASREMLRPLLAELQWRAVRSRKNSTRQPESVIDYVSWQIEHTETVIQQVLDSPP